MRLTPAALYENHSAAEDRVYRVLKSVDVGRDVICLHSLNVSDHHPKKIWTEIDFVIVGRMGIYSLEVKGGGVRCHDGIWEGVDRYGAVHRKKESPFEQVKTAAFALRTHLVNELGNNRTSEFCLGWGVVFPDVRWSVVGPEMPRQIVCDRDRCLSPGAFEVYLKGLFKYWRRKRNRSDPPTATGESVTGVVRYLRPDFDVVPSMASLAGDATRRQVALTEEQYEKMDAIEEADRIICYGGAGTGKSFLALQSARREAALGRKVLVVARSPVFTKFLGSQGLPETVRVTCIADFLPENEERDLREFDTLIVDEGQDLLQIDALSELGRRLKGGLEGGRWRWFMDPNNQAGIEGTANLEVEDILRSLGAVPLKLRRNCRNTPEIVTQTQLATGADIGTAKSKGWGLPPHVEVVRDRAEATSALENRIRAWLTEGVLRRDIAILSPVALESSVASSLPNDLKNEIDVLTVDLASQAKGSRIVFSTIRDFKGLERKFTAVIDLDDANLLRRDISLMYVAMTRANFGLWMAVSPAVKKAIDEAHVRNVERMANSHREGGA